MSKNKYLKWKRKSTASQRQQTNLPLRRVTLFPSAEETPTGG
jgi:hypothetical protein